MKLVLLLLAMNLCATPGDSSINGVSESQWVYKTLSVVAEAVDHQHTEGYIIVGDSRTVGMDMACSVEDYDNVFVVAKTSMGYNWLTKTAVYEIDNIKTQHPEICNWTIVSNLGVNDLDNCGRYIEFYKTLSDRFVFVSVNPVKQHSYITNDMISDFNSRMQSEFEYIDTYTVLQTDGYSSSDGVHYSSDTYRLIFSILLEKLCIH